MLKITRGEEGKLRLTFKRKKKPEKTETFVCRDSDFDFPLSRQERDRPFDYSWCREDPAFFRPGDTAYIIQQVSKALPYSTEKDSWKVFLGTIMHAYRDNRTFIRYYVINGFEPKTLWTVPENQLCADITIAERICRIKNGEDPDEVIGVNHENRDQI